MREILFKAKRVDNGEWVEGYYIKATHHWHEHGKHEDWIVVDTIQNGGWCNVRGKYAIIPETLCQFTGLCDKHGKRIWENDIVCSSEYKGVYCVFYGKHNISCCGCCYQSHQSVGFYISKTEDALTSAEEDEWGKWEVIGNRFDNPELLTAERIDNGS